MAASELTTNLPTPARALAVAAHPDDVEFGCGATFAKWAASGCEIHHLICTDAHSRPGRRCTPRRRGVRLRRHVCKMGGERLRDPSPHLHRRIKGVMGPE